ncbi:hypothetical protein EVAR_18292_1 [Eumeta japonica]|uniref:Uncharacterized protein n=1 Tax=Eumeta variegata TaxID=151549 RepID=A0A4C1VA58_EUMVA|nr:hypothetical protein EVAR_18292_1 [Eumeta japonica]
MLYIGCGLEPKVDIRVPHPEKNKTSLDLKSRLRRFASYTASIKNSMNNERFHLYALRNDEQSAGLSNLSKMTRARSRRCCNRAASVRAERPGCAGAPSGTKRMDQFDLSQKLIGRFARSQDRTQYHMARKRCPQSTRPPAATPAKEAQEPSDFKN